MDALTQALLDLKLGPDRPVAILSGNSIEHALMTMAAMQAGAPAAPVSPAYSLMSQDHAKLRYIFELIRPGLVMVQDGVLFAKALAALDLQGVTLVHVQRAPEGLPSRPYAELAATAADAGGGRRARRAHARQRGQAAVHLGLHRHAQGGDQHPAHDVRQRGDGACRRAQRRA